MPRAYLSIRRNVVIRWDSFEAGLKQLGFNVLTREFDPKPDDVLVQWNRMSRDERTYERFAAARSRIIISENGWLNHGDGDKMIALSRDQHNGAGRWQDWHDSKRWESFGIQLEPWRDAGNHILVLAQRGFGNPGVASPRGWIERAVSYLQRKTKRPIVVRQHPGRIKSEPDFRNCWAVATWSSGAAIKAIRAGIPVFYEMPKWIGGKAARFGLDDPEHVWLGNRIPMFSSLAWAQWKFEEIATGEPFRGLLEL